MDLAIQTNHKMKLKDLKLKHILDHKNNYFCEFNITLTFSE